MRSLMIALLCLSPLTFAFEIETGAYEMKMKIFSNGTLVREKTDIIQCLDGKNLEQFAIVPITMLFQKCTVDNKIITDSSQTFTVNCFDNKNQPITENAVIKKTEQGFKTHTAQNKVSSNELTVELEASYKGACNSIEEPKTGEQYTLTSGYYDFEVTTKHNDKVIKVERENTCIKSGQQVVNAFLDGLNKNCKVQLDNHRKDYFAVTVTNCESDQSNIHFSTMSKEKTLSILRAVSSPKEGSRQVFKMGRLIGECP